MTDPFAPISAGRALSAPRSASGSRFGLDDDDAAPGALPDAEATSASETATEKPSTPASEDRVRSARAGAVMASGTIVSRVLGLVRTMMLASAIGVTGAISDIWDLANVLPNQLFAMIAGGVFSAILVPLIIRATKAADGGVDYLSRLVTLLMSFMAVVTVIITVSAPWIIEFLASQYSDDQKTVAIHLAYFLLPQIFFYGMYAILGQVLNAHESFGPYMWAPVLNNVVALITLGLFMALFGAEKNGVHHTLENWTADKTLVLALGTTLGIVVQALVLLIPLKRLNLGLRPNFHFRGVGLREAGTLAGWAAATMVIGNIPFFVYNKVEATITAYRETVDSSHTVAGATVLTNASMLYILPHAVIAVSLATILVNRLSRAAADGDTARLASSLNAGIRTVGLPMILCSSAIIVVAGPLGLVFAPADQRGGVFIGIATILLSLTAPIFSASVFMSRAFYSLNDAKTPFFITVFVSALSIALAYCTYLVHPEIRIFTIAAVTSLSTVVSALVTHLLLRRKIGSYSLRTIFDSWAKFTVAAFISAAVGVGVLWLLGGYRESGFAWAGRWEAFTACAVVTVAMGAVYLVLLRLWKTPELNDVIDPVLARLRR